MRRGQDLSNQSDKIGFSFTIIILHFINVYSYEQCTIYMVLIIKIGRQTFSEPFNKAFFLSRQQINACSYSSSSTQSQVAYNFFFLTVDTEDAFKAQFHKTFQCQELGILGEKHYK